MAVPASSPAQYSDGQTARVHAVSVTIEELATATDLIIQQADGTRQKFSFDDLRVVPDAAHGAGMILFSTEKPLARLILHDPGQIAFIKSNARNLKKRDVETRRYVQIAGWAGAAIASVLLIIFVIIPALADRMAAFVPAESEQRLGQLTRNQIRNGLELFGGEPVQVCTHAAGQAALDKMTARMLGALETPLPLEVQVFDHPMQNAFAMPGGYIVLFEGLISAAENPEQVAGVLAHEIGHVVNRDPLRLALRSSGTAGILGLILGDFTGGAFVVILTDRLISASHSQEAETAADDFAVARLNAAGVPTEGFAAFFEALEHEHGDNDGVMSHFASHPNLKDRAEKTRAAGTVTGDFEPVLTQEEWNDLRNMCQTYGAPAPTE